MQQKYTSSFYKNWIHTEQTENIVGNISLETYYISLLVELWRPPSFIWLWTQKKIQKPPAFNYFSCINFYLNNIKEIYSQTWLKNTHSFSQHRALRYSWVFRRSISHKLAYLLKKKDVGVKLYFFLQCNKKCPLL